MGWRLRCEQGLLWVTQTHDNQDYLLRAGEEFRSGNNGKVVVQALEPASFMFTSAEADKREDKHP